MESSVSGPGNKDGGRERGALAGSWPLVHQQRMRDTLSLLLPSSQVNPHLGIPTALLQSANPHGDRVPSAHLHALSLP